MIHNIFYLWLTWENNLVPSINSLLIIGEVRVRYKCKYNNLRLKYNFFGYFTGMEVTGIDNPSVVNDDITVSVATPQKSQPLWNIVSILKNCVIRSWI